MNVLRGLREKFWYNHSEFSGIADLMSTTPGDDEELPHQSLPRQYPQTDLQEDGPTMCLNDYSQEEVDFAKLAYVNGRRGGFKTFSQMQSVKPLFLEHSIRRCIKKCDICKTRFASSFRPRICAVNAQCSCRYGLCGTCFNLHHCDKDLSRITVTT